METIIIKCSFCNGTGTDQFRLLSEESVCQVCLGKRELKFAQPMISCVFCKGSGVYPGKRITCTVCSGKGVVLEEPNMTVKCLHCRGSGAVPDSGLPCLKCKGRGRVSK